MIQKDKIEHIANITNLAVTTVKRFFYEPEKLHVETFRTIISVLAKHYPEELRKIAENDYRDILLIFPDNELMIISDIINILQKLALKYNFDIRLYENRKYLSLNKLIELNKKKWINIRGIITLGTMAENIPEDYNFYELKAAENKIEEYALVSNIIMGSDRYFYVELPHPSNLINIFVKIIENEHGEIVFNDNSITFKELRFFSVDGVFYQLKDVTTVTDVEGSFDCVIVNLTNNFIGESEFGHCYEMTLEKGTSKTAWQNVQFLNKNQRVLCFKNDGKWISMYGEINRIFNEIYYNINNNLEDKKIVTIEKVVKKNGNVGIDCDYNDIKQALESITDNGYYKRYKIKVFEGIYDYSNNGENIGIKLKNYVEVEGVNKSTTIIKKLEDTFDWGKADISKPDFSWSSLDRGSKCARVYLPLWHFYQYRVDFIRTAFFDQSRLSKVVSW